MYCMKMTDWKSSYFDDRVQGWCVCIITVKVEWAFLKASFLTDHFKKVEAIIWMDDHQQAGVVLEDVFWLFMMKLNQHGKLMWCCWLMEKLVCCLCYVCCQSQTKWRLGWVVVVLDLCNIWQNKWRIGTKCKFASK